MPLLFIPRFTIIQTEKRLISDELVIYHTDDRSFDCLQWILACLPNWIEQSDDATLSSALRIGWHLRLLRVTKTLMLHTITGVIFGVWVSVTVVFSNLSYQSVKF